MSKKCTPFWREAHFQVKSRSDVVLRGRRKGLCTLSKVSIVSKMWGFCGSFKNDGRRGKIFTVRHQLKKIRDQKKKFIFPALAQCFGPFMPFSNLVVFESPGPSALRPLVPWSLGPLVPWSSGPLVLRSLGPRVLWSFGPLVLPSFGGSGALKHFEDNP